MKEKEKFPTPIHLGPAKGRGPPLQPAIKSGPKKKPVLKNEKYFPRFFFFSLLTHHPPRKKKPDRRISASKKKRGRGKKKRAKLGPPKSPGASLPPFPPPITVRRYSPGGFCQHVEGLQRGRGGGGVLARMGGKREKIFAAPAPEFRPMNATPLKFL